MTDRPAASNILPPGGPRRRPVFSVRQLDLVLDAQGVVSAGPRLLPALRPQGLVIRGGCNVVATERVSFLFADGRALYYDALEMLAQGKIRNAAEKAWGATKRATDALVLARTARSLRPPHRGRGGACRPALMASG